MQFLTPKRTDTIFRVLICLGLFGAVIAAGCGHQSNEPEKIPAVDANTLGQFSKRCIEGKVIVSWGRASWIDLNMDGKPIPCGGPE